MGNLGDTTTGTVSGVNRRAAGTIGGRIAKQSIRGREQHDEVRTRNGSQIAVPLLFCDEIVTDAVHKFFRFFHALSLLLLLF